MPEAIISERANHACEVAFTTRNTDFPFVGLSEREGCTFELAKMIPRGETEYAEYFNISGTDPERMLDLLAGHENVEVTLLKAYESGGLFELIVPDRYPAYALAELGAIPQQVRGKDGTGHIVVDIPAEYDPPAVVESFMAEYPDVQLTCKHQKSAATPLFTRSGFEQVMQSQLTDRQEEVLRAAFERGYYEWPRDCTGQELAEDLDISSATFSEHIHAAERKLLTLMFDGASDQQNGHH